MRERLQRFMWGRYGYDELGRFLMISAVVCMVLSLFPRGHLFYVIAGVAMVYAYFRMFSRNIGKRSGENRWFLNKTARLRALFGKKKREMGQMKQYHIYRCPKCRQKIRVPRGRGRIAITCRKCGTEFIKKS
ncbi:MAG: hypothetical protein NC517_07330 [Firmicutes bacterium]|nr:hypothetical protein [Bacillota bacterium]